MEITSLHCDGSVWLCLDLSVSFCSIFSKMTLNAALYLMRRTKSDLAARRFFTFYTLRNRSKNSWSALRLQQASHKQKRQHDLLSGCLFSVHNGGVVGERSNISVSNWEVVSDWGAYYFLQDSLDYLCKFCWICCKDGWMASWSSAEQKRVLLFFKNTPTKFRPIRQYLSHTPARKYNGFSEFIKNKTNR